MIKEFVGTLLYSIGKMLKAIFDAFFQLLPIYNQLSEFKDQMIAAVLGVPLFVISLFGLLRWILPLVIRLFKIH